MGLLVITAVAIVRMRDLVAIVMLLGIYSLISAGFFVNIDAVDVAMTEAAVGAGISTVLMLGTLAMTSRKELPSSRSKLLPLFVVTVTGAALIYGTLDMPHFTDPAAPIHQHVAPRYINEMEAEIGIPNMVTAVLASYRGYDTLGETTVIFTAGLGVMALLGRFGRKSPLQVSRAMSDNVILRVISRALIPFILMFGLYVQFHGELGPGGGFQAGVMVAVAFILYAMVFGIAKAQQVIPSWLLHILTATGVLIYGGTGVVAMLAGGVYLDYDLLAHDPVHGQHLGIFLVELGVGITVSSVMLSIFFDFTARRELREGEDK